MAHRTRTNRDSYSRMCHEPIVVLLRHIQDDDDIATHAAVAGRILEAFGSVYWSALLSSCEPGDIACARA